MIRFFLSLFYAPIVYFVLKYFNTTLDNMMMFKSFPLIISSFITLLILYSYIKKKSIILYFAQKIFKKKISKDENIYIYKSTLFWAIVSFLNVIIHFVIFLDINNATFWIFYSSVGWYLLFAIAGIFQYIHRKFIFLKRLKNDN